MNEEIQAIIQFCNQIGPDDFEMRWVSKTFDKSTTLQQIEEWAKQYGPGFSIFDVKFATNDKAERLKP